MIENNYSHIEAFRIFIFLEENVLAIVLSKHWIDLLCNHAITDLFTLTTTKAERINDNPFSYEKISRADCFSGILD